MNRLWIISIITAAACSSDPNPFVMSADTDTSSPPDDTDTSWSSSTPAAELDTGPDTVCSEYAGCDPRWERCEVVPIWVCPLRDEPVSIDPDTYRDLWLICQPVDGIYVCPTTGYHRPCTEIEIVGTRCIDG